MNRLVRRITRNGLIAAVILGVAGLGLAEASSLAMTAHAGREAVGEAATADALRRRLPLGMAAWGFFIVAVVEVGLHFKRGQRPQPTTSPAPSPSEPVGENSPVSNASNPG